MTNDQQHAPASPSATVTTPSDREIHIERIFEARRCVRWLHRIVVNRAIA